MTLMTRIADKTGTFGSIVSAFGCAACFPAIASIGAALGLGFLQEYEGLFISRLMPLFAAIALVANALGSSFLESPGLHAFLAAGSRKVDAWTAGLTLVQVPFDAPGDDSREIGRAHV